jgi:hypothetical protein
MFQLCYMLNYLKLNKFAVTMFAQSRTYNRKSEDKNKTKYRIYNPFRQLFSLFLQILKIYQLDDYSIALKYKTQPRLLKCKIFRIFA